MSAGASSRSQGRDTLAPPPVQGRLASIGPGLRLAGHRFGTPAFVTDVAALSTAATELAAAFPDPWLRQFSLKANDVTAIVARIGVLGLGANVVSHGEWAIARRAGIPDDRVTLEGAGKSDRDLAAAVRAAAAGHPPRWVAVESRDELEILGHVARAAGLVSRRPPLDILLRLNPDVAPETHHTGLAVGVGASKFGMTETELTEAVERAAASGSLRPRGIHLHIGSQLLAVDAWRDAVRRALAIAGLLRGGLADFDTLDIGGGFAVGSSDGDVPSPARFARELPALVEGIPEDRRPARWAVEPGRFLVARASWIVASVLHVRDRDAHPLIVIDAGMTELMRPALYGARHPIVALTSGGRAGSPDAAWAGRPTRVDGPICESTDALGLHDLPPLRRGDLVAIGDAGAYGASMASSYNGRPRPPQILLEPDGRLTLGRRRGSVAGLG